MPDSTAIPHNYNYLSAEILAEMTKRQLKNEAYRRIIKDREPHDEVFESLAATDTGFSRQQIADELAKHPAPAQLAAATPWKMAFIVLMAIIILMRCLAIFMLGESTGVNAPLLLLAIAMGLLVPVAGIVIAVQNRADGFRIISIFLALAFIRSVRNIDLSDPVSMIGYVPFILAVVLGLYLAWRLKTSYLTQVETVTAADGSEKKQLRYVFSRSAHANESVIDD
jgi:hypothetical protein